MRDVTMFGTFSENVCVFWHPQVSFPSIFLFLLQYGIYNQAILQKVYFSTVTDKPAVK